MTEDQFNALSNYLDTLIQQHTQLMTLIQQQTQLMSQIMAQVQSLWIALVIFAFIGIVFIGVMMFAAAWSVRVVNKRQGISEEKLTELASKFTLLIDILLEDQRHRRGGQS